MTQVGSVSGATFGGSFCSESVDTRPGVSRHGMESRCRQFHGLGWAEAHEWLVPKLPLGNPIAGKAPALRENHLLLRHAPQARAWGKFTFPSRSLGTRERRDARRFPALRATGYGLLMKRPVGRASSPAVAISSWCVRRTLRKTLNFELELSRQFMNCDRKS